MRTHTQFDPSTQFDELMTEMESSIYETLANFERLTFLRKKIAEEMTAAQAAADRLELLTEAEAGQLFKNLTELYAQACKDRDAMIERVLKFERFTDILANHLDALLQIANPPQPKPDYPRAA